MNEGIDGSADKRIFTIKNLVKFSDEKAIVNLVAATEHSIIFAWGVKPGQEVEAHTHPKGQDTWIMVQGELTYYLGNGQIQKIKAGQIDVAPKNVVHGCVNEGNEDAIFISIYSPRDVGYEEAKK
ncbi:MAG TPA: cupin domain-containing protein [Candidatus Nanoarchaeia archaeon]|nr:cupin domain-containing protein [Candidatus Nanoarchaeia archaeon]